jgi:hypothetical protein
MATSAGERLSNLRQRLFSGITRAPGTSPEGQGLNLAIGRIRRNPTDAASTLLGSNFPAHQSANVLNVILIRQAMDDTLATASAV